MTAAVLFVAALVMCAAAVEYLVTEWRLLVRTLRGMADDAP